MEMKLQSTDPAALTRAEEKLRASDYEVDRMGARFHIRGMNLVPRIHDIYKLLEQEDISVHEMKIRENTLEDVFIHLTGKSLRR